MAAGQASAHASSQPPGQLSGQPSGTESIPPRRTAQGPLSGLLRNYRGTRLRTKLILLICLAFMPSVILLNLHVHYLFDSEYRTVAGAQSMKVARVTAEMPLIKRFMRGESDLFLEVESVLEALSEAAEVRFIVLAYMNGKRAYHPVTTNIGHPVAGGDEGEAFKGKSYLSYASGTFGLSWRAFQPIYDDDGGQIGIVIVGKMSDAIKESIARFVAPIWPAMLVVLLFGVGLAALLSRSIIRILHGLEPEEIARRLEERGAIMQAVREGVIAVDASGRVTLVNGEAERLLQLAGVRGDYLGRPVTEVVPNTRLPEILESGESHFDEEQNMNGTLVLTNRIPVLVEGRMVGAVSSFRDMTDLRELAEKLTGASRYVDALRSQSHEFLNKLHVMYGLARQGQQQELAEYLAAHIGMREKEEQAIGTGVKDPVIAGFLSSKFSRSRELGMELSLAIDGTLPEIADSKARNSYITILGNLIDNGLSAMENTPCKRLEVRFTVQGNALTITVSDTGSGISPDIADKIFTRNFSTKGEGRGLGLYLVLLAVDELNGTLEMRSEPGRGSVFTVRLPVEDDSARVGG